MPQFTAVSRERHAGKAWQRYTSYAFTARDAVLPLVVSELTQAVMTMPVAFVKQDGRYVLMAVLSLTPGRNLFVAPDGRWLGEYVPAVLRSYPFRLLRPEGAEESILCVDEHSGLVGDAGQGEAFFDADGGLADTLKRTLDFLSHLERSRAATEMAVAALAEAGVIESWPLTLKNSGAAVPVIGLHRIAENRFNALDDEAVLKLRRAGALPIVYMQLLSMQQTPVLTRLAELHEQHAKAEAAKALTFDAVRAATFENACGLVSDQGFRLVF
jgi:SapC